jgi:hypothetical protein
MVQPGGEVVSEGRGQERDGTVGRHEAGGPFVEGDPERIVVVAGAVP